MLATPLRSKPRWAEAPLLVAVQLPVGQPLVALRRQAVLERLLVELPREPQLVGRRLQLVPQLLLAPPLLRVQEQLLPEPLLSLP